MSSSRAGEIVEDLVELGLVERRDAAAGSFVSLGSESVAVTLLQ